MMINVLNFKINSRTKALFERLIPLGLLYGLVLFVKIRLEIIF